MWKLFNNVYHRTRYTFKSKITILKPHRCSQGNPWLKNAYSLLGFKTISCKNNSKCCEKRLLILGFIWSSQALVWAKWLGKNDQVAIIFKTVPFVGPNTHAVKCASFDSPKLLFEYSMLMQYILKTVPSLFRFLVNLSKQQMLFDPYQHWLHAVTSLFHL